MNRLQRWLKKYLPDAAPPIKAAVADGYELALKHALQIKPEVTKRLMDRYPAPAERLAYVEGCADAKRAMREALKELEH